MTQTKPQDEQGQVLVPLTTPEEVDTFLAEYPQAAVFKAGTCHKTMQGFGVLETPSPSTTCRWALSGWSIGGPPATM